MAAIPAAHPPVRPVPDPRIRPAAGPGIRRLGLAALLAALLCLAGPAAAAVPYTTQFTGLADSALRARLRDNSQLVKLEGKPPASAAALQRRAAADRPLLLQILHDAGYWAASLDIAVVPAGADKTRVTVRVTQGPLYHLTSVVFRTPEGGLPPLLATIDPSHFGLAVGGPARAAPVIAAQASITGFYADRGYPFARVTDRHVVVDDGTQRMSVTYTIDVGPAVRFGPTRILGLTGLAAGWIRNRMTWQAGTPYDARQVEATRKVLVGSNLFSVVRIAHAAAPDPDGTLPMTITLAERRPHSVGVGAEYSTTLGPGASLFWEDRNLFGNGEDLRITTTFAAAQLGVAAQLRQPDFITRNLDLVTQANLAEEIFPAYDARVLTVGPGVERRFDDSLVGGAAVNYEQGTVSTVFGTQGYGVLDLPVYLRRDTTGNLLDPQHGTRSAIQVTPYAGVDGTTPNFIVSQISGSAYRSLLDDGWLIAAGYLRVGSISGASAASLPADKRLYAGGTGGSVRGYGFQRVGPLENGDKPIGGISSLEFGGELRGKVTDTIGLVPFVDAGNVYETSLPKIYGRLFVGAGLGLRYYTAIGPVRLDLATPVTPIRPGDSPIQVYISLGQAF